MHVTLRLWHKYALTLPYRNGNPPTTFATTRTEAIKFSIGFRFAALIYISLHIFREFYIDFVDIHGEIRVFT
jgi:hypothetical protein